MDWKHQKPRCGTSPRVVVNDGAPKILLDFQIQTDKMVMYKQLDIAVINKLQKKAVVKDAAMQVAEEHQEEGT